MLALLALALLLSQISAAGNNVTSSSQCQCGYQDPNTKMLYTESIILYFNETGVDEDVFEIRDYQNKNQRGWNTLYKQGASPSNVVIGNNGSLSWQDTVDGKAPSLQMWLDGVSFNHFSKGAELRSVRRDIIYGTFRASMRSAQPWVGGSAMSMYLNYNNSQSINIDLLNMQNSSDARVMHLVNGEWPEPALATNYSVLEKGEPTRIPPLQPFDFMDVGYDWTNDTIDFWVGANRTRHISKLDRDLTSVPQTLYLSHWSTGDTHYMDGPPYNRSLANVRWIRAFFNSSLMTSTDHQNYDEKCHQVEACSVEDMTLRGSSAYSPAATVPWNGAAADQYIRETAGYVAASFSVIGIIALINAIIRRRPWYRFKNVALPGSKRASTHALRQSLRQSIGVDLANRYTGPGIGQDTPVPGYSSRPGGITPQPHGMQSGIMTPLPAYDSGKNTPRHSPWHSVHSLLRPNRSFRSTCSRTTPDHSRNPSNSNRLHTDNTLDEVLVPSVDMPAAGARGSLQGNDDIAIRAQRTRAYLELEGDVENHNCSATEHSSTPSQSSIEENLRIGEKKQLRFSDREIYSSDEMQAPSFIQLEDANKDETLKVDEKLEPFEVPIAPQDKSIAKELMQAMHAPDALTGAVTAEPAKQRDPNTPNQPQQRIDYLAGLVAICCVMVTLRHFSLTFWPYVTEAQGGNMHFEADLWLSFVLGPYILTPLWIGPFFVTSCRFLAQRYLRTGKLDDIANKMLLRAPRMLIPVFVFITLEYFLISLGLTNRLEWLPSVTYSTWPYVIAQPNFGIFLNELVELSYLQINAAPEIINHYCIGVLWTIPVQLQFSFVVLLATVLVKDVKRPWKRMLFYSLSIVAGWYGSSWSACHWLGLLLADADITYNWVKWTQARWWVLYPVLTIAFLLVAVTPLVLLFNSDIFYWSFMAWENGIHPDIFTANPLYTTLDNIWLAYPDYYAPSFAVLTFSLGLQVIVELSTWVQKALSTKVITFFHPHIMTIYLSHGFVFWSLGAYVAVALSNTNLPYWAILIITAVVCYTVIFLFTIIATPLIEFATKGSSKNIWRWATEEPVPHVKTTAPFTKQLVLGRQTRNEADEEDEIFGSGSKAV